MMGRAAQPAGEHHRDLLGAADPDVVGHERLEEAARAARVVEHERAGRLDLAHGELPPVPDGAILGGQRCRDLGDPAVEERLHMLGAEGVADRLQPGGVRARREPVVQLGESKPVTKCLPFGPFVAVSQTLAFHGA